MFNIIFRFCILLLNSIFVQSFGQTELVFYTTGLYRKNHTKRQKYTLQYEKCG